MRPARCLLAALLLAGPVACGGSGPGGDEAAPLLTAELRQFRSDLVLHRAQVTVRARVALTVQTVQVRAPGFAVTEPTEEGVAFPAGGLIDLPVGLGGVLCDQPAGAGTAVLTLSEPGAASRTVEVPLTDDGLLVRLHEGGCADLAVSSGVGLSLSPTLIPGRVDGKPALRATLQVQRRASTQRFRVVEPGGNVIFDVSGDRTPVLDLAPDQHASQAVVTLVPSRCDAHALTESKRTSLLAFYVSLGDDPPRLFTVEPDAATRAVIERFAADGCRTLTGR